MHNGIEYCELQLIAEVYDVLKNVLGMSNEEMAEVFDEWQQGELSSYLLEITSTILRKKDDTTGIGYVVNYIVDQIGMKGTGMWSVQEASEKGVAVPTMAAALDVRLLSARKEEREASSKLFGELEASREVDKKEVIADLRASFYASRICSYAQGLRLIRAASDEYKWKVDNAEVTRVWCGGCVIRSQLVADIHSALSKDPSNFHLLLCANFAERLKERVSSWRRLVALCVTSGIGCPSLCASLSYFDTYRRASLPANLTQAQRDFFGGHTYQRIDKEGRFHTAWTASHKDIGSADDRHYGVETLDRHESSTYE